MMPKINTEDMDIIYGIIIGDGWIQREKNKNANLSVAHCPRQLEYLQWKLGILKKAGFKAEIKFKNRHPYPLYLFWTNHHPFLTELYSEIYAFKNTKDRKRKRITKSLLDKCTIRTLAVWFLDDGYNFRDRNGVHFGTYGFDFEEQKLISDWIYRLTDASFKIYKRKEQYFLVTYKDALKFLQSIKPYCPNLMCMEYKLKPYVFISKGETDLTRKINRKKYRISTVR